MPSPQALALAYFFSLALATSHQLGVVSFRRRYKYAHLNSGRIFGAADNLNLLDVRSVNLIPPITSRDYPGHSTCAAQPTAKLSTRRLLYCEAD